MAGGSTGQLALTEGVRCQRVRYARITTVLVGFACFPALVPKVTQGRTGDGTTYQVPL